MERKNSLEPRYRHVVAHQPQVRPTRRIKGPSQTEFGAKLSVENCDAGLASMGALRWAAYHEASDIAFQVRSHRERRGRFPVMVIADKRYGTRTNRK